MNTIQKSTELVPTDETATVLSMIAKAAADPAIDIDKLERLMNMRERMEARMAETAFNQAMNRAQGAMRRIATDSNNPQTHSRYASYAALDRALRPLYVAEGFSLSFDNGDAPPSYMRVLCHVSHADGFTRTYHTDMPADGKGAKGGDVMTLTHASGAAMTYGMRYLLKMIFNVAIGEDDNDGNEEVIQRISEAQEAALRDLAAAVGANMPRFLAYLQIDKLSELRASRYKDAAAILEAKRAKS